VLKDVARQKKKVADMILGMIAIIMMSLIAMALVYFTDGGWIIYGNRLVRTLRRDETRITRYFRLLFSR
jgi:hypothetical protein